MCRSSLKKEEKNNCRHNRITKKDGWWENVERWAYTKYFLSCAEEYTQGNIRSMKELRLVHVFRKGRRLCSRKMCSRSIKDAGTMFGFKSGAHVWMKSSVDTEKVLVRHSVACAVPSVRVVHVLWECPDCTGTLECTATVAIEHTVSLIGSMHNWLECVDFCVHSICVLHASTLCPDMGNFILLSSLVSFLSCNLHLSIFSLSVFSTSPLSHKHRLVYYHTWICSLAHYLYAHMYTCTTHSTHAIVSTQMHAYTCMHTYRSGKW